MAESVGIFWPKLRPRYSAINLAGNSRGDGDRDLGGTIPFKCTNDIQRKCNTE